MNTLKSIAGREVEFGGESHRGWLPAGSAVPLPTPRRVAILDFKILEDQQGAVVLEWKSRNSDDEGDRWYASMNAAISEAEELFGIAPTEWS
jgi:hypothetical protein